MFFPFKVLKQCYKVFLKVKNDIFWKFWANLPVFGVAILVVKIKGYQNFAFLATIHNKTWQDHF